jgi:hypothetical protein
MTNTEHLETSWTLADAYAFMHFADAYAPFSQRALERTRDVWRVAWSTVMSLLGSPCKLPWHSNLVE